ncbi:hypothetical protein PGTUg99_032016 [Puccinia graminis f. sp. tritici]|uniref:Uncharacterized protein n=1 Tax=Puccinia graminis f. sp. tritici TaxID=56615 RepID=A0A5B0R927_PUCGR|nr:hypothetical protein PGTUg99_032016 [Puccinia graminis f. sp. tritici]
MQRRKNSIPTKVAFRPPISNPSAFMISRSFFSKLFDELIFFQQALDDELIR